MIDPEIEYWASLCESDCRENDDLYKEINETYEKPYSYDPSDGDPKIVTVGDLKKVLANFKDNDHLEILTNGDTSLSIKAMWNANMEYEMTDNDVGDNVCFIRVHAD